MRWLVVRGGALGDFLLTLPALEAVRRVASRLTLVASPRYAALRPDLWDELVDLRGTEALWLFGGGRPPGPLPDAALVYTPEVADELRALGVAEVRAQTPRPPAGVHALAHLGAPVADLGPSSSPRITPGPPPPGALDHPIVLAPGAAAPSKIWGGFAALAALLEARGLPFVWAPGRDEAPPPMRGRVLHDLSLAQLAGLAGACRAWVGNDTGTTHLAVAAGARTIALFGPTDPACWAPVGAEISGFGVTPEIVLERLLSTPDIPLLTLRAPTN